MGLDTTHDCWSGPYSAFNRWRAALCEAAGFGNLYDRVGFRGDVPMPPVSDRDVLWELLDHSDCDGNLAWEICGSLAGRLETLLPKLGDDDYLSTATLAFIEGLRSAFEARENVEFC